jgi:hypothetical protein
MGDADLQQAVHEDLQWKPRVDAAHVASSGELLRIVVGYDGSAPASRALDAAVRLLKGRAGCIDVVGGSSVKYRPVIVIWRFTGTRLASPTAKRRAQQLVAISFYLLANTLLGAWWLDGAVALGIAGWAVIERRRAWAGRSYSCAPC